MGGMQILRSKNCESGKGMKSLRSSATSFLDFRQENSRLREKHCPKSGNSGSRPESGLDPEFSVSKTRAP